MSVNMLTKMPRALKGALAAVYLTAELLALYLVHVDVLFQVRAQFEPLHARGDLTKERSPWNLKIAE